jgi:hypothetical protein
LGFLFGAAEPETVLNEASVHPGSRCGERLFMKRSEVRMELERGDSSLERGVFVSE